MTARRAFLQRATRAFRAALQDGRQLGGGSFPRGFEDGREIVGRLLEHWLRLLQPPLQLRHHLPIHLIEATLQLRGHLVQHGLGLAVSRCNVTIMQPPAQAWHERCDGVAVSRVVYE